MAKKLKQFLPAMAFAAIVALAALMLARGPEIHTLRSPMVQRPLPDFKMAGFDTAALKGRPAVLVFFASWCAPCVGEQPVITRLAKEGGVPVYGIEYRDTKAQHDEFFSRFDNPYTKVVDDADGQAGLAFGVIGLPTTMIVGGDGVIRYRRDEPMTDEELDKVVFPLLGGLR